jgi:hypothetical protein
LLHAEQVEASPKQLRPASPNPAGPSDSPQSFKRTLSTLLNHSSTVPAAARLTLTQSLDLARRLKSTPTVVSPLRSHNCAYSSLQQLSNKHKVQQQQAQLDFTLGRPLAAVDMVLGKSVHTMKHTCALDCSALNVTPERLHTQEAGKGGSLRHHNSLFASPSSVSLHEEQSANPAFFSQPCVTSTAMCTLSGNPCQFLPHHLCEEACGTAYATPCDTLSVQPSETSRQELKWTDEVERMSAAGAVVVQSTNGSSRDFVTDSNAQATEGAKTQIAPHCICTPSPSQANEATHLGQAANMEGSQTLKPILHREVGMLPQCARQEKENANMGLDTQPASSASWRSQSHHTRQKEKCITFVRKLLLKVARLLFPGGADALKSRSVTTAIEMVAEVTGAQLLGLPHPVSAEVAAKWSRDAVRQCKKHSLCTSTAAARKASDYFSKEAAGFSEVLAGALCKHKR